MKASFAAVLLVLAFCASASAQTFRVRMDSVLPPARASFAATSGQLSWKECEACAQQAGTSLELSADSAKVHIAQGKTVNRLFIAGNYRLTPSSGPAIAANYPLELTVRDGKLQIIAAVPLENYVAEVVSAESGDFQQAEALKAMAVAVRTYALALHGKHQSDGFDFCDSTHCQAMHWSDIPQRIRAAVAATNGQILMYRGKLAAAYYTQNCGGVSAAANEVWPTVHEPYLKQHADPYCVSANALKWESSIAISDLNRALKAAGLAASAGWTALEIASRTPSGRAEKLRFVGGSPPNVTVSASSFRFAVDRALGWEKIRSNLYEVRSIDGAIRFSGRGSGHGVGLCQAGAEEMAREGKSFQEILSFYYPGTEISSNAAQQWTTASSAHFELMTESASDTNTILNSAERVLKDDEDSVGWTIPSRITLQVFPTMDAYRDSTGEPGWAAASTRGRTIRLQPIAELQSRGVFDSTLRHEIFHLLVESCAKADMPLWFREGLTLYLSDPATNENAREPCDTLAIEKSLENPTTREATQRAYAAAKVCVANLVARNGKRAVLGWLSSGIPANAIPGTDRGAATPHN